jgi:hypothetical protein
MLGSGGLLCFVTKVLMHLLFVRALVDVAFFDSNQFGFPSFKLELKHGGICYCY